MRGTRDTRSIIVRRLLQLSLAVVAMFFIAGLVASSAAYVVYRDRADGFVSPADLAINEPAVGAKIYDRNGVLLYEVLSSDYGIRNPVRLDQVAPAFLAATIATEDQSFYENAGINLRGIVRAGVENLNVFDSGGLLEGSGGSSITQQLVKNVYIDSDERSNRSLDRKLTEVVYALEMTRRYDKDQILEWYVNQINYGGLLNGVQAAARAYFDKPASELTLAQAAFIAGMPQSPARYDPYEHPEAALARRNEVLDLMAEMAVIPIGATEYDVSPEAIAAAKDEAINLKPRNIGVEAPHFVFTYLLPRLEELFGQEALQRDGLEITTSLDLDLQNRSTVVLEKWVAEYEESSNTHNGAMMILDPNTGEILTMIGSRDYYREDIEGKNNNLLALNSPGSSFKPFVYMAGIVQKNWTPATMLDDTPTSYVESDGTVFRPENPTRGQYLGRVTMRNALGNSLNIPAFKAAQEVTVPKVIEMAEKFGFTTFDGFYGPAIAIGGTDIRGYDLTYGYSTLANEGVMVGMPTVLPEEVANRDIEPASILKVVDDSGNVLFDLEQRRQVQRVVSEGQAYMMADMLSDPQAQCITFGCGGVTIPGMDVAVKTGTSEPFDPEGPDAGKIGETWAFGYTPDFVVGVWAGNANNDPIVNIYSTTISFRAMRDALLEAYNGREATPFTRPDEIVDYRGDLALKSQVGSQLTSLQRACDEARKASEENQRGNQGNSNQSNNNRNGNQSSASNQEPEACRLLAQLNSNQRDNNDDENEDDENAAAQDDDDDGDDNNDNAASGAPGPGSNSGSGTVSASIASPQGTVSGQGSVRIMGTASAPNMAYYRLDVGSNGDWQTIGQWARPVVNGALGAWVVNGYPPGQYTVRLTVVDQGGSSSTSEVTLSVAP